MRSRRGRLGQGICASAALALLAACPADTELRPFASDGCSLFPDASVVTRDDWCSCCFEHDTEYWRGGTYEEREAADAKLRECVHEKTGNQRLAVLMYEGVRAGGSPYFYNWYRWGYGWGYDRKYQALTPAENARADALLDEYFSSGTGGACL